MNGTNENIMKCCFTGYRPVKFPFSMDREDKEYKRFENTLIEEIISLIDQGCFVFYNGMAMGFDIIAAETVLLLKEAYPEFPIRLISVIPFKGQVDSFNDSWKERYNYVLDNCDEKVILSENYFSGCYQKRNIYMVQNSDVVLTWYDGKSGGTKNTLDYAASKGRYIINCNKSLNGNFAVQERLEIF